MLCYKGGRERSKFASAEMHVNRHPQTFNGIPVPAENKQGVSQAER